MNDAHLRNEAPFLDLTRYAFKRQLGDITVYGTWIGSNHRPALALVPTFGRLGHETTTPCIVQMDNAWLWDEERGDFEACVPVAVAFCPNLGLDPNSMRDVRRVMGIIHDSIGDMIGMKPWQAADTKEVAVMEWVRPDGTVADAKGITEDV